MSRLAVTIDNAIRFRVDSEFRKQFPDFFSQLGQDLRIPNPQRLEAKRLGRRAWGIPKYIDCYEWDLLLQEFALPRGYLEQFEKHCAGYHIGLDFHYQWDSMTRYITGYPPVPLVKLRDYQVPAFETMLLYSQGILEAPPGSGKTVLGLHLVAARAQRTLWLTHTRDLAKQTAERAEQVLGIPQDQIGLIGAGVERMGNLLTIGLVQTLIKRDLSKIAGEFGMVILDEAHHCPAEIFKTVVHAFPAFNRYGLSGSLQRDDKLETISHLYLGPTRYKIELSDSGTVTPTLQTIRTNFTVPAWEEHQKRVESYEEMLNKLAAKGKNTSKLRPPIVNVNLVMSELLQHPERNELITKTIVDGWQGHSTLVLSARIDHCRQLAELVRQIAPDCHCAVIHGGVPAKQREEIINAMRSGELDVLFSVQIAKEGLDIPRLDRMIRVAGGRSTTTVKQEVGRIQRTHPGKTGAQIIDIVDMQIGVLRSQYYARRSVYRELGVI